LPILFKPMGTPKPEANYIASDADYVDFITELMGGFSIPPEVKELRKGKQYLLHGPAPQPRHRAHGDVRHDLRRRRTGRLGLDRLPTDKERRFCKKQGWN
jgi:hypothetical protein